MEKRVAVDNVDAADGAGAGRMSVRSVVFVPDRRFTAGAGAGVLVALGLALITDDAPGRLLALLTAAVLAAYVLCDLYFSPRLEATPQALTIRSPLARAVLPWDEVDHVRADTSARWGLRSTTLEIDAGATLVVLSRRSLGAEPQDVADAVLALRG